MPNKDLINELRVILLEEYSLQLNEAEVSVIATMLIEYFSLLSVNDSFTKTHA